MGIMKEIIINIIANIIASIAIISAKIIIKKIKVVIKRLNVKRKMVRLRIIIKRTTKKTIATVRIKIAINTKKVSGKLHKYWPQEVSFDLNSSFSSL